MSFFQTVIFLQTKQIRSAAMTTYNLTFLKSTKSNFLQKLHILRNTFNSDNIKIITSRIKNFQLTKDSKQKGSSAIHFMSRLYITFLYHTTRS